MTKIKLKTALKPYPKCKDSGVEWIGEIPREWTLRPLFAETLENTRINTDGALKSVLSLSYGRIVVKDADSNFGLLPASFNTYQIVEPGQTVMRLTDLQNDHVSLRTGFATQQGIITSAYLALSAKESLRDRYLYYLLHGYDINKVYYGMGGGVRQSIGFKELKRMPLLLPPADTQRNISSYLDEKTKLIDEAIERKKKLIELLKERRAAVITHAVTKGLDPKAPLIDSGIPWIGKIPKGWQLKRLKHVAKVVNGATPSSDVPAYWEGPIPWATPEDLSSISGNYLESTKRSITEAGYMACGTTLIPSNNIIISTRAPIGLIAINRISTCINQGCRGIVVQKDNAPEYLYHVVLSAVAFLNSLGSGSTFLELNRSNLENLFVPVPGLREQELIASRALEWTERIDRLADNVRTSIVLLTEYKQSLIHHVVMGKVQV